MTSLFNFKDNDGRLKTRKIFLWAALIVIAICVVYFIVMYFVVPTNMEKRGQLGDMYGLIGALFSGLAFAGVIVTMLQQREDLQNQRDEIKLQREDLEKQTEALKLQKEEIRQTNEELKLQRKEMEEQNKTIMLQRFETTFFNMLDIQMDICNSVKLFEYEGKDAIERIFRNCESMMKRFGYSETKQFGYDENYLKRYLDHYFRHLIQTLKMIDTANFLSAQEKYYYSDILSSHMSIFELGVFFYYCLSDEGKATAKELVESLALFKCFKNSDYIPQEGLSQFSDGAFTQQVETII